MRAAGPVVLLIAIVGLGSLNTVHSGLILDDLDTVVGNPHYRSPRHWPKLFLPGARPERLATYRPVRELTFAVDQAVWRGAVWGRHVSALVLYGLVVWAVWLTGRRLGLGRAAALLAACYFAVHGGHSETLGWLKNRGELLAALFGLACLYAFLSTRAWTAAAAGLVLLAALGSMESAVSFAGVALIAGALAQAGQRRRLLRRGAMLAGLAVAYALVQTWVLSDTHRPHAPAIAVADSVGLAADLAGRYAAVLLVPVTQCMDAAVTGRPALVHLAAAAVVLLVVGLTIRRGRPALAAALVLAPWALAAALVVRDRPVAEHRAFVCSAGLALCLGFIASRRGQGRRRAGWLLAAAVCTMACLFVHRHFVWRSDARVWRDNVLASPTLPKARRNLAFLYARDERLSRAERQLTSALACYPAPLGHVNATPRPEELARLLHLVRQQRRQDKQP